MQPSGAAVRLQRKPLPPETFGGASFLARAGAESRYPADDRIIRRARRAAELALHHVAGLFPSDAEAKLLAALRTAQQRQVFWSQFPGLVATVFGAPAGAL